MHRPSRRAPGHCFLSIAAAIFAASGAAQFAHGQAEYVLSDFNGTGFDYTFDNFAQTVGPTSVRLRDTSNGWGGAGLGGALNLGAFANGRLVVDFIPQAANAISTFTIELIEQSGGGQTLKSGKWDFPVGGLAPGVPTRLVSTTPLSQPLYGEGAYSSLNLSQLSSWQVLGQFGSNSPFDISFDRISATTDQPVIPPAYPGAEPNAPWRAQAASRIDAIRKADLAVSVVDRSGAPLPGAAVHVAMQEHAFGFGSAVQAYRLRDNNPQHATYKAKVAELFNLATIENNLKWPAWEGEWGSLWTKQGAVNALNWLAGQGIEARGHTMVWPGDENLPADIRQMLADDDLTPAEQQLVRTRVANHIANIGAATFGKIGAWDVVNETRTNNDLMRELAEGNQALTTWFQQAAAATPAGTDLYLNDFNILNRWGRGANREEYYNTIQTLQNNGAPISGVGFQGHFTEADIVGPEEVWGVLDDFAALGLAMQVTEFDFDTTNEQLQADYLRDFMTAVFAHEGIDDFIMWGFWEGAHWRPNAAMFRNDWSIKPSGQAYLDLVFDQWWTDEVASANSQGVAAVRGFKGSYEVTASVAGRSVTLGATLGDGGESLTAVVPVLLGDYNSDGVVDSADYSVWRDTRGSTTLLAADGNFDGVVNEADYAVWASRFGATALPATAVPEPTNLTVLVATLVVASRRRRLS